MEAMIYKNRGSKPLRILSILALCMILYISNSHTQTLAQGEDNTPKVCPPEYDYYSKGHTCYKYFSEQKNWDNARNQCLYEGEDLAVIKNEGTEKFFTNMLTKIQVGNVWLGLKEIGDSRTYRWVDGNPLEYSNWNGNEPSNDDPYGPECIELTPSKRLNDLHCTRALRYFCERSLTVDPACPSGYTAYATKRKCVRFGHDGGLTWNDARKVCQQEGGDLAVIKDDDYNTFIKSFLRAGQRYWIGLNRGSQFGEFLQWVDGSLLVYTQWSGGQPDNYASREDGVEISLIFDGWNDHDASISLSFLCQQDFYEPRSCRGENWVSNREHKTCYLVQKDERTFHESRVKCQQEGGDLLMVTTDDERMDYFRVLISGFDSQQFWINDVNTSLSTANCTALLSMTTDNPYVNVTQDACNSTKPSVCTRAMVRDGPVLECPHGYTTYVTTTTGWSITCLMADNSQEKTMSGATLACKDDGGDLYSYIQNESDMNSFVKTNLVVKDDAYWYKSDCQTYIANTGNRDADCSDNNNFICRHWGSIKQMVQLRDVHGAFGQHVYDPNAPNQNISLLEMCRTLNMHAPYSHQYDWIRTTTHVSLAMERNWTTLTMDKQNTQCHYFRQSDCCVEVIFNTPTDLKEEFLLSTILPKDKISCLCSTPLTNEIIDLLNNLTKSTKNSSSPPPNKLCPCRCGSEHINFNPSPKELTLILSRIQNELKVDAVTLSSKRNKKVSAKDTRTESTVMGYFGVVLCLIPMCFLVSVDLIRFAQFIKGNKIDTQ